jgi:hypothetical protein
LNNIDVETYLSTIRFKQITFMSKLFLIFILFVFSQGLAQNISEKQLITSSYDFSSINQLTEELRDQKNTNERQTAQYLSTHPSISVNAEKDQNLLLERIDRFGQPVYITTHNLEGGQTINVDRLYDGGDLGLNLQGQGITAGIWDGGYVRQTHNEFGDRVEYGEGGKSISGHGTHVGGTMIARGATSIQLRGMAPAGNLLSFRFDNDGNEMLNESSDGLLISNHSYGRRVTESTDIAVFGKYDQTARNFDAITELTPYYLPVVSAGNDNGKGLNSLKKGYDLLTDRTLAKNVVTVGAVFGLPDYSSASDVRMSSFSSWGPTDDGRIKPDVVAKGVSVLSTSDDSNTDTAVLQGTSMSSPMVSGAAMLLQELFNKQTGRFMRAATLKGVLLSTAQEAGDNPGPDYRFGWGLVDAASAAQLILNNDVSSIIAENSLNNGDVYEQVISSRNNLSLTICLSWTDPAGTVPSDDVDDRTPALVNDLDIKAIAANGTEFFPFILDPENPREAASTGVNNVDNIEIINIPFPAGNYTIRISHKNGLSRLRQNYSLLVNGAAPATASNGSEKIESLSIFPNPARNFFNITFSDGLIGDQVNVQVYNTLGQQVIERSFNNTGNFNERIDASSLTSGLYLVKISDGDVSNTRKLVIK